MMSSCYFNNEFHLMMLKTKQKFMTLLQFSDGRPHVWESLEEMWAIEHGICKIKNKSNKNM